jgi:N-acetylmuramoyl-L-alanine amidase
MKIVDDLLTTNQFSRSGRPLVKVMALVVHYLGAPGQSAHIARDYWEGLKSQDAMDAKPDISASAHYIVDLDGTIYRTIPETEKAYHCGAKAYTETARAFFGSYCTDPNSSPNRVTIGIEITHPESDGKPNSITLSAARVLLQDLCRRYGLDPGSQIFRHYDITGKDCPRWFVAHPDEWRAFIESV